MEAWLVTVPPSPGASARSVAAQDGHLVFFMLDVILTIWGWADLLSLVGAKMRHGLPSLFSNMEKAALGRGIQPPPNEALGSLPHNLQRDRPALACPVTQK